MTELAKTVALDYNGMALSINGVEFPYFIAEAGPHVEACDLTTGGCFTVWIPVLANQVHIDGEHAIITPPATPGG